MPSRSKESRSPFKVAWAAVGVLATLIGLITAWPALEGMLQPDPHNVHVVRHGHEITLTAATPWPKSGTLVGSRILISGDVTAPQVAALIADEINFSPGARLHGRELALVSTFLGAGQVDVSGQDGITGGPAEKLDGEPGGIAIIAAVDAQGLTVRARGGRGADGAPGPRGSDGPDGDCAGFGGWKAARPGQSGSPGGKAGSAGRGGRILILLDPKGLGTPTLDSSAGAPGIPGQGGAGGRGGSGCVGLGGSQTGRSSGVNGEPGPAGRSAPDGIHALVRKEFRAAARALRGVDMHPTASADSILRRLESINGGTEGLSK